MSGTEGRRHPPRLARRDAGVEPPTHRHALPQRDGLPGVTPRHAARRSLPTSVELSLVPDWRVFPTNGYNESYTTLIYLDSREQMYTPIYELSSPKLTMPVIQSRRPTQPASRPRQLINQEKS